MDGERKAKEEEGGCYETDMGGDEVVIWCAGGVATRCSWLCSNTSTHLNTT